MRGINSFVVDIGPDGIIASGGVAGTSGPGIDRLFTTTGIADNILRIYVRKVPIRETISNSGKNTFTIPVTFGLNKAVIFINGDCFIPNIDYTIQGNLATWLYPDVSIAPTDDVIIWGPANEYTAQAITFENVNLNDSTVYPGTGTLVNLKGSNGDTDNFPYNEKSIYVMLNGKQYTPGASPRDFEYNVSTQQIDWHGSDHADLIPASDRMFIFYFNLQPTPPFRLGEALVRFTSTDGVDNITLNNPPSPSLNTAPNVFLDKKRYVNEINYRFRALTFAWLASAGVAFNSGQVLDVSYFSDLNFGTIFFNDYFIGSAFSGNIALLSNKPVIDSRGFLFMNGLLSTSSAYDNILSPAAADYEIVSNGVHWIGSYTITSADKFVWSGLKDVWSSNYIKLNYYSGVTIDDTPLPLTGLADPSKIIVWRNGLAQFNINSALTVASDAVTINDFVATSTDQVTTFHFNNPDYADLWKFEQVTYSGDWVNGTSKNLTQATVKAAASTWLFINGSLAEPGSTGWTLNSNGTSIRNNNMGALPDTTEVMVVYLKR